MKLKFGNDGRLLRMGMSKRVFQLPAVEPQAHRSSSLLPLFPKREPADRIVSCPDCAAQDNRSNLRNATRPSANVQRVQFPR